MNEEDRQSFVEAWIEAQQKFDSQDSGEPLHWSIEEFHKYPYDNPELAWDLIVRIHQADTGATVRDILAAGPLEDLITAHGSEYIDRVAEQATQDESFRKLMRGVWFDAEDTPVLEWFYELAGIDPPFDKAD